MFSIFLKELWVAFVIITLCHVCSAIPPLSTTEELTKSFGYSIEKHEVQTRDGYILTLVRIPGKGQPVLFAPGLFVDSDSFLLFNRSLAYELSKNGNDIWLGNYRGTRYSRKHKSIAVTDVAFWNFSLDEIGIEDTPAMINYVLQQTKQTQLHYIGHSAGTSVFFTMVSEKPQMLSKIKSIIALGPIYSLTRFSFLLPKDGELYPDLIKTLNSFKENKKLEGFVRKDTPPSALQFNCTSYPEDLQFYCEMGISLLTQHFDDWAPSGVSPNFLIQFFSAISSGKVGRFDHGKEKNIKIYKKETPPEIQINKMEVPTYLVYSTGDELLDISDIEIVKKAIPQLSLSHEIENDDFQHANYVLINNPDLEKDYLKLVEVVKTAVNK